MEDEFVILHDKEFKEECPELPTDMQFSFFAVYDGHGGSNIASYAATHLHKNIAKSEADNLEEHTILM